MEMVTSPASVGGTGEVTGAALHGFCLFFFDLFARMLALDFAAV